MSATSAARTASKSVEPSSSCGDESPNETHTHVHSHKGRNPPSRHTHTERERAERAERWYQACGWKGKRVRSPSRRRPADVGLGWLSEEEGEGRTRTAAIEALFHVCSCVASTAARAHSRCPCGTNNKMDDVQKKKGEEKLKRFDLWHWEREEDLNIFTELMGPSKNISSQRTPLSAPSPPPPKSCRTSWLLKAFGFQLRYELRSSSLSFSLSLSCALMMMMVAGLEETN